MASSRLERLRELLHADLAALPDVPLDLDDSDGDLRPNNEPGVAPAENDQKPKGVNADAEAADDSHNPTSWVDAETQRNYLLVPSDAEDSDAGCVLELVPLTDQDEAPALTPDCTGVNTSLEVEESLIPSLGLRRGQLAPPSLAFCPIIALAKFPYKHIEKAKSERVADFFFNAGKFWTRTWDLFYVWPLDEGKPLVFVSDTQFFQLLEEIDSTFNDLELCNQKEYYWDIGLLVQFENHPRFRPRYLGRCTSRNAHDDMAANVPSVNYSPPGEKKVPAPDDRSLEAFRRTFEDAMEQHKQKSKRTKAARKSDRIAQQQFIGKQLKRAQRYLGLRPKYTLATVDTTESNGPTVTNDTQLPAVDPEKPAPHLFEEHPVIISVDVEAHEINHNVITEVGITTLDTKDLIGVAPGKDGANWFSKARHRHFRIEEFKHIVNNQNIQGCPDRFEFGQSEFVKLSDAPAVVASCFREPFSRVQTRQELETDFYGETDATEIPPGPPQKRAIILIGHAPEGDIRYLQQLGYNPLHASNLVEVLDTAALYRIYRREQLPTNLGTILYNFDMVGWSLHNAGNDAAYTLQAFLGIAVRDAMRRGDPKLEEEYKERAQQALKDRLSEAVDLHEADQRAFEADVEDDGGEPFQYKSLPKSSNGFRRFSPQAPAAIPENATPKSKSPEASRASPSVTSKGEASAAQASDQETSQKKSKFPPPNLAPRYPEGEAAAAVASGLSTSRYADGGEAYISSFPFRGNRKTNGRTFTDRLNRVTARPPPEAYETQPSFVKNANGEWEPNMAIYDEVMAEDALRCKLRGEDPSLAFQPLPPWARDPLRPPTEREKEAERLDIFVPPEEYLKWVAEQGLEDLAGPLVLKVEGVKVESSTAAEDDKTKTEAAKAVAEDAKLETLQATEDPIDVTRAGPMSPELIKEDSPERSEPKGETNAVMDGADTANKKSEESTVATGGEQQVEADEEAVKAGEVAKEEVKDA